MSAWWFVLVLPFLSACSLLISHDGYSGGVRATDAAAEAAGGSLDAAGEGDAGDTVDAVGDARLFDDFDAPILGPGWTFTNPKSDSSYSLTELPGHLVLWIPGGVGHDCWTMVTCPRIMRPVANDSARRTFTVAIKGGPSESTQAYGLLLWRDAANFVRFELDYGIGAASNALIASWVVRGGSGAGGPKTGQVTLGAVNVLRAVQDGPQLALSYSTDAGSTWTDVPGSPLTQVTALTEVGVHVINSGSNPATKAVFDSFSIE